ncbi:HU family DNA-binding protein [Streptococcus pneumoniae]|nr:HU family DNA-binding protein [Streptococcus pneumoniae]
MANKQDLIAKVAEATELTKKDSAAAVEAVFAAVADYLAAGEKVQLIGFGNFEVRERAERKGRNPQTGKEMSKIKFKPRQFHLAVLKYSLRLTS